MCKTILQEVNEKLEFYVLNQYLSLGVMINIQLNMLWDSRVIIEYVEQPH